MKHVLPRLEFAPDALAPFLSDETLSFHLGKHHRGYVEKLNALLKDTELEPSQFQSTHRHRGKRPMTTATKPESTGKDTATVKALERLLADSYTLYLKTHSYHWNVTGPMFSTLHTMFETQYTELALAVDEIAERIRALEAPAPGSYSQFMEHARVKEDRGVPKAMDMIRNLVADHEAVAASGRKVVKAAGAAGDDASADLGVRRIDLHEKTAWMLRSHLE